MPHPQIKGISAADLHDLLDPSAKDQVVLIDVRTPEERAVSRIPGTVLTKEEFESVKEKLKDKQLVVYW